MLTGLFDREESPSGMNSIFEEVFESAPIGIALVGLNGKFQVVNNAFCGITEYNKSELTQLTQEDITHTDDLHSGARETEMLLKREIGSYQVDKRFCKKNGDAIWVRLSVSIVQRATPKNSYFIIHVDDISTRKSNEELLMRQATRDALTGVLNRTRFEEELARHQLLADRRSPEDLAAVLMIDVDGLKEVNDQGGHAAGDKYLKKVAAIIGQRLRASDVFARIGGDEFAVLLPHISACDAQQLARSLADIVRAGSGGSVSIGVGIMVPGASDGVLERADRAMYLAKEQGGGQACGP